jgi:hypothetical protein
MKSIRFSTLLVLIMLAQCGRVSSTEREFAIYLPVQKLPPHQLSGVDLADLELEDTPILSVDDIVAYSRETHEIELTASAYERIGQLEVPVDGMPFVVCVGRDPIYLGAFWPLYSSLSFDGVVIQVPLMDEPMIQITLGYPSSPFFAGEDPRSDPRILQALAQAGKLK